VTVTWNGTSQPETIVDFAKGTEEEVKKTFSFELTQDQIKQFFIGKKEK
jgi:hypothetical protein